MGATSIIFWLILGNCTADQGFFMDGIRSSQSRQLGTEVAELNSKFEQLAKALEAANGKISHLEAELTEIKSLVSGDDTFGDIIQKSHQSPVRL